MEGSLYLLKGHCVRPFIGHFSYLTLKITWGEGVIKCVFIDEEIEPPRGCLDLPKIHKAIAWVPAHSDHSNTHVLSHPFNWPPPAVLLSHDCMCKLRAGGHQSHTLSSFWGGGTCWRGLSVFASRSGARLLWPVSVSHVFLSASQYLRAYWEAQYSGIIGRALWRQSCVWVRNLHRLTNFVSLRVSFLFCKRGGSYIGWKIGRIR